MRDAIKAVTYLARMRFLDFGFRFLRPVVAVILGSGGAILRRVAVVDSGVRLTMAASRLSDSTRFTSQLISYVRKHVDAFAHGLTRLSKDEIADRSIILAAPRMNGDTVERKGVYLITFTGTCGAAFTQLKKTNSLHKFHYVLEPSWSGLADPDVLVWASLGEPVVVQAAESADRHMLTAMDSGLYPVPWSAGDWIDPEIFCPIPGAQKIYDAIWVGNYGWYKRPHAYLQAIRAALRDKPQLRAALVLAKWGSGHRAEIDALIRYLGLENRVDVFEGVDQESLNKLYNHSKCCVLTSWKEGGNRAIYEAMFADVPAIVLRSNIGVNKNYLDSPSGITVDGDELPQAILTLAKRQTSGSVRSWALENISPRATTDKLVKTLDRLFPGDNWKFDQLRIKVNAPEVAVWESARTESMEGDDVRVIDYL